MTAASVGATRLGRTETWELLSRSGVGVLATTTADGPDVFPVNYLVAGDAIVIRTAPGTKTGELGDSPRAAFAAYGNDRHGVWSVVIQGDAELLPDDVEAVGSSALELVSWAAGEKDIVLRIAPRRIEGRRMPRADLERPPRFT